MEVEDKSGNRSQPATVIITVERLNPEISGLILSFGEWENRIIIQGVNFDPEPQKNIVAFNGIDAIVLGTTDTIFLKGGIVWQILSLVHQWKL